MTRSRRTPLLVGLAVLVLLVLVSWLRQDDAAFPGRLDPRNPGPDGAQAVARVLDSHGVDVQIVRDQAAYLASTLDAGTTVVVTDPQDLGRRSMAALRRHAAGAGALVLVGAPDPVVRSFHLTPGTVAGGDVPARCALPLARDLTVRVHASTGLVAAGCFGDAGIVLLSWPAHDARVWLLTSPEVLSNDHVLSGDNAALSLRLLGQHPRLVWYVADPADITATDAVTVASLLPDWLFPALWVLLLSVLAFLVWRSRRLGPLVREPLPVVVRAAESTESRGRLYRRTRDRDHAARILRAASRHRLGDRLAVPDDAPPGMLAVAVAASSGRDPDDVARLLTDAAVVDDSDLAALGRDLLRLEAEANPR